MACGPPDLGLPPIVRQAERSELGTNLDVEVCAGTLAKIDRHIENVEGLFGFVPRTKKLSVYVLENREAVGEYCLG